MRSGQMIAGKDFNNVVLTNYCLDCFCMGKSDVDILGLDWLQNVFWASFERKP